MSIYIVKEVLIDTPQGVSIVTYRHPQGVSIVTYWHPPGNFLCSRCWFSSTVLRGCECGCPMAGCKGGVQRTFQGVLQGLSQGMLPAGCMCRFQGILQGLMQGLFQGVVHGYVPLCVAYSYYTSIWGKMLVKCSYFCDFVVFFVI